MLIKEKDPIDDAVQALEAIINTPHLPANVISRARKELQMLRAGDRNERDAAYYINFHYQDRKNWAVIHDLRLEVAGRVAQIDHLLIGRLLDFYVLESKSFGYGVKITADGEFLIWQHDRFVAIPSPIEQNRRHVLVLRALLKRKNLLPKRLGMTLSPTFRPYVLVSPKSRIARPPKKQFDTRTVIKADLLFDELSRFSEQASTLTAMREITKIPKVVSPKTIEQLARQLVRFHKPRTVNYWARFGITPEQAQARPNTPKHAENAPDATRTKDAARQYFCAKCGKTISRRVAMFCFQHKERFGGRAYCMECQKGF